MDRKVNSVLFIIDNADRIEYPLGLETKEIQDQFVYTLLEQIYDKKWVYISDPSRSIYINTDKISQIIIKYEE